MNLGPGLRRGDNNMQFWIIQTLNSLALGGLLFLLAAGFSLIFGLMRIANLTHGSLFMLGAYLGVSVLRIVPNLWLAALLAAAAVALCGGLLERLLLRPLTGKPLGQVLVTLGISFIVADLCLMIWGGDPIPLAAPASLQRPLVVGSIAFPAYRLVVLGIAIVTAIALHALMEWTRIGAMIRAGVDDMQMARAVGIPVSRLFTTVFCLGAALAGAGGVIAGPIMSAYPGLDAEMLPLALIVVILGGVGSLLGAFIGSFLIAAIFATSLNLLVGYGGLVSLGHASWIGLAAYTSAWLYLRLGLGHWIAAPLALLNTTLIAGLFGWIALRATGLGFLMITLALSQVLWGTAYRRAAVTNGDNGLSGLTRPAPFGISLDGPAAFYYFSLTVTIVAVWMMARLVNSPFGAALRGSRDESRRMSALGHNVWLVRWLTFVYSGFWGAVAGLLFVYYHKYIHPTALSLTSSAEVLLGVIAGGAGTIAGPIVGAAIVLILKNYVSAYLDRWNMLLGAVFVVIVIFMPDGIVPGIRRWSARLRKT